MSGSFFTIRKDSIFAPLSAAFSAKINATPTAYNLTAGLASNYASLNGAFQSAYAASIDPATRTKSKVEVKNSTRDAVKQNAALLAQQINASTTVTDAQKIDLGLAVRGIPTPVGPLGKPTGFKCGIDIATGALELSWKNTNPRGATGVVYQIWRQIGATGTLEYLGGVGPKKFTDDEVPAGSSQVIYKIQAVRSTSVGPFAQFTVNIGTGGSTTVTETTPVKLAA